MGHTSNSLVILPFSVQISRESFEMEEEMKQEEAEQIPSTSKDENAKEVTKYRLNRSLSLRSIEQDPPKEDTNPKKRKNPPSPKGAISVKETTSKFDQLANKYKSRRNMKDTNKEKSKFKRTAKKNPVETVEDPITKMLKKMMTDITEIKTDVKGNNTKIDDLTLKVEKLETKNKENEESTNKKFKLIKNDINKVEENVTSKLLKEIEPPLNAMRNDMRDSMGTDIRRIVQEELSLRELKERSDAPAMNEEEKPEK